MNLVATEVGYSHNRDVSATLITSWIAWLGLFLSCRFLWTKIDFNTEGSGWILLPLIGLCVITVSLLRLGSGERFVSQRSFTCTALFMMYFVFRLAFDSDSASDIVGYTLGYGEGILFAYGFGIAIRILIDTVSHSRGRVIRWIATMAFLGFNVISAVQIEQSAVVAGHLHRLYALIDNETYQLSGAFTSVIVVIVSALVVASIDDGENWGSRATRVTVTMALAIFCLVAARFSQVMGSNASPAFVVPLGILVIALLLTPFGSGYNARNIMCQWRFKPALWGRIWSVLGKCVALSGGLMLALWIAVVWGWIDITKYRIFEFEEQTMMNSSVVSRLEILVNNFAIQFEYAPIFGNFFVDRLTTGSGTYIHSLLAVIPHLGFIGAAAFVAMLVTIASQLRRAWLRAPGTPRELRRIMLAIGVVVWAALFLLLTNFFTNIVLWMPLGLFVPAFQLQRPTERVRG